MTTTEEHAVVSHEEWLKARTAFLAKEKEFTRLRDEVNRQRREMPWERVDQQYVFETRAGKRTLSELFDGRSQLIVYHFMFAPEWDEPCEGCSFWADNFNGIPVHLAQRDVTFVVASRAPLSKIDAFKKRMEWSFDWVSTNDGDFNYDYFASFRPEQVEGGSAYFNYREANPYVSDREGVSVFYRKPSGEVFHTYSSFARGIDLLNGAYNFLDLTPKGRDEAGLKNPGDWVKFHDRY